MEHDKMINLHVTRQTFDFDCGVKALQTVMAYYGVHVREDKLIKELGADQEGARVERMIAVAEAKGFRVQAKEHMTIAQVIIAAFDFFAKNLNGFDIILTVGRRSFLCPHLG